MVIAENIISFLVFAGLAFALFLIQYWKNRALKIEGENKKELVDAILNENKDKIMGTDIDDLIKLGNKLYGPGARDPNNPKE